MNPTACGPGPQIVWAEAMNEIPRKLDWVPDAREMGRAEVRVDESAPASADVVVVGAGMFGGAVACHLAEAGMGVVVVERSDFCGEASGANVGLVTVSAKPMGPLFDLAWMGLQRYDGLEGRLGRPICFRRPGTMNLATTAAELAERRALTEAQRARGLDVRHIDGDEARTLEPWLPAAMLGGSFCPVDGAVYPFEVVRGYLAKARACGARLLTQTKVTGVMLEGGRVAGVETTRGAIRAPWVVNAAGAWANEIGAMVGVPTPMVPVKGQVLVTAPLPVFQHTRHVVFGIEPALRQMPSGNALIAATIERVGYDKRLTAGTIKAFAREIVALHPRMAAVPLMRGWAGLRPGTPDDYPILGASRAAPGFVVATGAYRSGMLYGPAVGELIADEILERTPAICLDPFRPERFAA
ncbi:MAG: NAD(P)/FAD-dependent oxidoreductase [Thermomicrobiales bacterium]